MIENEAMEHRDSEREVMLQMLELTSGGYADTGETEVPFQFLAFSDEDEGEDDFDDDDYEDDDDDDFFDDDDEDDDDDDFDDDDDDDFDDFDDDDDEDFEDDEE